MRFRLHKLLDADIGTRQHERIERGPTWLDDELQVSYLKGDVTFTRSNDRILLEAALDTATTVQCVRSLELFEMPLQISIDDVAFRLPGMHVPMDDGLRKLNADLWVDLKEDIREAVLVAIPINPVHPDYRDARALDALVDKTSEDWLTIKWADKDDDQQSN